MDAESWTVVTSVPGSRDEALTSRVNLPDDVLRRIYDAMAEADNTCSHRLYGACRECSLAAVVPLLRAHIADQLRAIPVREQPGAVQAMQMRDEAARVARGGDHA
jgi:hypothetical protein